MYRWARIYLSCQYMLLILADLVTPYSTVTLFARLRG